MIEIANLSGMPDCENTLLMSDSTAERFRMTNKLPRPLEEGLKTNYNLKTKTDVRGEATEFTLNSLPLPLGEGWGEGLKNNYNPTTKTEGWGEGAQALSVRQWPE